MYLCFLLFFPLAQAVRKDAFKGRSMFSPGPDKNTHHVTVLCWVEVVGREHVSCVLLHHSNTSRIYSISQLNYKPEISGFLYDTLWGVIEWSFLWPWQSSMFRRHAQMPLQC